MEHFRPFLASCLGPEAKTHLIGAPRGAESSRVPSTGHPCLGRGEAWKRQVDGRALGPSGEPAGEPGERCLDIPHTGKAGNEGRPRTLLSSGADTALFRRQGRRGPSPLSARSLIPKSSGEADGSDFQKVVAMLFGLRQRVL